MELLSSTQCFDLVDGKLEFIYTAVFFRQDGVIFRAKSPLRKVGQDLRLDTLKDVTPFPTESICPPLPADCTLAPGPGGFFVKRAKPSSAGDANALAALVVRELAACEIIRKNPHPNLALYHGCLTSNGRVTGLCFTKYPDILLYKLNPGSFNKTAFIQSADLIEARATAAKRYLPGIAHGIQHLHSLGIIHNDLNPANIAITEGDEAVIIDFDSSTNPGVPLDHIKRTHGWFDRGTNRAQESNDLAALREIEIWLNGSLPEEFQFSE